MVQSSRAVHHYHQDEVAAAVRGKRKRQGVRNGGGAQPPCSRAVGALFTQRREGIFTQLSSPSTHRQQRDNGSPLNPAQAQREPISQIQHRGWRGARFRHQRGEISQTEGGGERERVNLPDRGPPWKKLDLPEPLAPTARGWVGSHGGPSSAQRGQAGGGRAAGASGSQQGQARPRILRKQAASLAHSAAAPHPRH